jgi:hypothetical protein
MFRTFFMRAFLFLAGIQLDDKSGHLHGFPCVWILPAKCDSNPGDLVYKLRVYFHGEFLFEYYSGYYDLDSHAE